MKDIAVFGAGGFGREVACLIRIINESLSEPRWNLIGFFDDDTDLHGTRNEYGEILGGKELINAWRSPLDIVVGIGSSEAIRSVVSGIENPDIGFPNIIAPDVQWLDKDNVRIGIGNVICSGCRISCNVDLGNFNILSGFSSVGHDAKIGNNNVFMPSCNISGGVEIGDSNFFGLKSAVLQFIKVGNNVRIGSGSILMRNAKDGCLYFGIPARKTEM